MSSLDIRITGTPTVDYHRNGVCGEPFHVVHFVEQDLGPMMAVVFYGDDVDADHPFRTPIRGHNPRVAVFQESQLPNTTFGINSWRGDRYADAVYAAIEAHDEQKWAELDRKYGDGSVMEASEKLDALAADVLRAEDEGMFDRAMGEGRR